MRAALHDAVSVASLLITIEAMIAEKPKDKPAMPGGGGMGGIDFQSNAQLTAETNEGGPKRGRLSCSA